MPHSPPNKHGPTRKAIEGVDWFRAWGLGFGVACCYRGENNCQPHGSRFLV